MNVLDALHPAVHTRTIVYCVGLPLPPEQAEALPASSAGPMATARMRPRLPPRRILSLISADFQEV